jgi:hypothetical protein
MSEEESMSQTALAGTVPAAETEGWLPSRSQKLSWVALAMLLLLWAAHVADSNSLSPKP